MSGPRFFFNFWTCVLKCQCRIARFKWILKIRILTEFRNSDASGLTNSEVSLYRDVARKGGGVEGQRGYATLELENSISKDGFGLKFWEIYDISKYCSYFFFLFLSFEFIFIIFLYCLFVFKKIRLRRTFFFIFTIICWPLWKFLVTPGLCS